MSGVGRVSIEKQRIEVGSLERGKMQGRARLIELILAFLEVLI